MATSYPTTECEKCGKEVLDNAAGLCDNCAYTYTNTQAARWF